MPPPDADVAGYHVYRNGKRLDITNIAGNGKVKVSSFKEPDMGGVTYYAENAVDNDPYTKWMSLPLQIPAWFRFIFDGAYPVEKVKVEFDPYKAARSFAVQEWNFQTDNWEDLAVETDFFGNPYELTFNPPRKIERLRLNFTGYAQANSSGKFAAYEISLYRGPGAETPVETSFLDDALSTRGLEYTYRVTAFDRFGNESIPSNEYPLDDLLPRVTIETPEENERVGSHVEIFGSIEEWRLLDYRLEAGRGVNPTVFTTFGTWEKPVERGIVATWEPPSGEEGPWTVRLVVRDLSGQETSVQRVLNVDTMPPPVPSGFVGSAVASDKVQLGWNPVSSPDLAGYLVYRSDILLNDPDVTPTATWYGTGSYGKMPNQDWEARFPGNVKIDQVELWWHPMATPGSYEFQLWEGSRYNTSVMVFENTMAHLIKQIPVPTSSNRFRIMATGPVGSRAGLVGVKLLDHERGAPIKENGYLDQGLAQIGYTYQVASVDDLGNVSAKTTKIMIDEADPAVAILSPAAGTPVTGPIDIIGTAADVNFLWWRLEAGEGSAPAQWEELAFSNTQTLAAKLTRWTPPQGRETDYTLRLTAADKAGRVGVTTSVVSVRTLPPSKPGGLTVAVTEPTQGAKDGSVTLTWAAPTGAGVVGYNIYRNGVKLNRRDIAGLGRAEASTTAYGTSRFNVNDQTPGTTWWPREESIPAWIALDFQQRYNVDAVKLDWYWSEGLGKSFSPRDYQIQTRNSDGDWVTRVFIENNTDTLRHDDLPLVLTDGVLKPVLTDGVRVLITAPQNGLSTVALDEFHVYCADIPDLVTATTFVDYGLGAIEGIYTIKAVDAYGNESEATQIIVDRTAPRIEVTSPKPNERVSSSLQLKGMVEDATISEIEVSYRVAGGAWITASRQSKIYYGDIIASLQLSGVYNLESTGDLRIVATDMMGNTTEKILPVFLDGLYPAKITGVNAVLTSPMTSTVQWNPAPEADIVGYYVYRSGYKINTDDLEERAVASASGVYESSPYFQPFAALDGINTTAWCSPVDNVAKIFELTFPSRQGILAVNYGFTSKPEIGINAPSSYKVEAYVDGQWLLLFDYLDGEEKTYGSYGHEAVITDRIRMTAANPQDSGLFGVAISEVEVQGDGLLTSTQTLDEELDSDETAYAVSAVDLAGNVGQRSDTLYLDAMPPYIEIYTPSSGELKGTAIPVRFKAEDPNFASSKLEWGIGEIPQVWTTVTISVTEWLYNPRAYVFLGNINAAGVMGPITIRATALDYAGNLGEQRIQVNVDGEAPGVAGGFSAAIQSNLTTLAWTAPEDGDISGYLIYRDGLLLTTTDLSAFGKAWATSQDTAFDKPENALPGKLGSWRSSRTDYDVAWGLNFEERFLIEAVEVNTYAKSIIVEEYSGGLWNVLATVSDNNQEHRYIPFQPTWVTKLRLRFPSIDGNAPNVYLDEVRVINGGQKGAVTGTGFIDGNITDPGATEHAWTIVAVDHALNTSGQSAQTIIDTLAPRLGIESPAEGGLVGADYTVKVSIAERFLQSWTLTAHYPGGAVSTLASGGAMPATGLSDVYHAPVGLQGDMTLTLTALDTSGNASALTRVVYLDSAPPQVPVITSIDNVTDGLRVYWTPPADSDVAGYIVYRDGYRITRSEVAAGGAYFGTGFQYPDRAFDHDLITPLWAYAGTELTLGVLHQTEQSFGGYTLVPSPWAEFLVQVKRGADWVTVQAHKHDDWNSSGVYAIDPPEFGTGVRVLFQTSPSSMLTEISFQGGEPDMVAQNSYLDWMMARSGRPEASYQVAAVDLAGNVGQLSLPFALDTVPPLVELLAPAGGTTHGGGLTVSGTVMDSLLTQWNLKASLDDGSTWQTIALGTTEVERQSLVQWTPAEGFDGDVKLVLIASDLAGNTSETQPITVRVDNAKPGKPTGLLAQLTEQDTRLTWTPNPETDLAGYRVFRNGKPLKGNIIAVAQVRDLNGNSISPVIDEDPNNYSLIYGPLNGFEITYDYVPELAEIRVQQQYGYTSNQWVTVDAWDGTAWVLEGEGTGRADQELSIPLMGNLKSNRYRVIFRSSMQNGSIYLASATALTSGTEFVEAPSFTLTGLGPREDDYTVAAVDHAGNESARSDIFSTDFTIPTVTFTQPQAGSRLQYIHSVSASVYDMHLKSWKIEWAMDTALPVWQTLATGTGGASGTATAYSYWNVPIIEGAVIVRVTAEDTFGNTAEATLPLTIDRVAPRTVFAPSTLYVPAGEPIVFTGSATDVNLSATTFKYKAYLSQTYTQWLGWSGQYTSFPVEFSTSGLTNGLYNVKMEASDGYNVTSAEETVNIAPVHFTSETKVIDPQRTVGTITSADTYGADGVWLLDSGGVVYQVTPDTGIVRKLPGTVAAAAGATDLAVAPGQLWLVAPGGLKEYNTDGYYVRTVPNTASATKVKRKQDGRFLLYGWGGEIRAIDENGVESLRFSLPNAVYDFDVDKAGYLYALVSINNNANTRLVNVYDNLGNFFTSYSIPSAISSPSFMAVDGGGRIVLSGSNQGNLLNVLSASGQLVLGFGVIGHTREKLYYPGAVGIYGNTIWVANSFTDQVTGYGQIQRLSQFTPLYGGSLEQTGIAAITSPADGIAAKDGLIVSASAASGTNTGWKLEIGLGASPGTWTTLVTGTGVVNDETLFRLNTKSYADGTWTLRLTVTGQGEPTLTRTVGVKIDNTAPSVMIATPIAGKVTGTINLTGTVTDTNLTNLKITVARADQATATVLADRATGGTNATFATWNSDAVQPGAYLLVFEATDFAGNVTRKEVNLSVGAVVYLGSIAPTLIMPSSYGDMARLPDGRWLYASPAKVQIYSETGTLLSEITKDDTGTNFSNLKKISVFPDGRFVVLNFTGSTGRVSVYTPQGVPLSGFDPLGVNKDLTRSPIDLAADSLGRIILLDPSPYTINAPHEKEHIGYHVLTTTGTLLFSVVGYGKDPSLFENPVAVDTDLAGNVYVLDRSSSAASGYGVKVFDPRGNFSHTSALPTGTSYGLSDISVNDAGYQVVAASTSASGDNYFLYGPGGVFLGSFVKYGTTAGLMSSPYSVWFENGELAGIGYQPKGISRFDISGYLPVNPAQPTATIESPTAGALVSANPPIRGVAAGTGVTSYRLEAGTGANPETWTLLSEVTGKAVSGNLGAPDLSSFPAGALTLRLTVEAGGETVQTTRTVVLDPTPPTLGVTPDALGLLKKGETIQLTTTDSTLANVFVTMGREGDAASWKTLYSGSLQASQLTVPWSSTDFPDGVYWLHVITTDAAGNRTTVRKIVSTGNFRYAGELMYPFGYPATVNVKSLAAEGSNLLIGTVGGAYRLIPGSAPVKIADMSFVYDRIVDDLAPHPLGLVYGAYRSSSVYIFNPQGQKIKDLTGDWTSSSQRRVGVLPDGSVLASLHGSNALYKFATSGALLWKKIYSTQSYDIAADRMGAVYRIASGVLETMDSEGNLFGTATIPSYYNYPKVAAEPAGRLVATETGGLTLISPDGRKLTTFGGMTSNWISQLADITWTGDSKIYVLNSDRLIVFDTSGYNPAPTEALAQIASPADGGWVKGQFLVAGSAYAQGGSYTLDLTGPGGVINLAQAQADVIDGNLGLANLSASVEGDYTLTVSATGAASASKSIILHLDRTPPSVSFAQGLDRSVLTSVSSIEAQISDPNLKDWNLKLMTTETSFTQLASGTAVVNGALCSINPATLDKGVYTLRLTATDLAGNVGIAEATISIGAVQAVSYVNLTGTVVPTSFRLLSDGGYLLFDMYNIKKLDTSGNQIANLIPASLATVTNVIRDQDKLIVSGTEKVTNAIKFIFLTEQGVELSSITIPKGEGLNQLTGTPTVWSAAQGVLAIANAECVKVFNYSGQFLFALGERKYGDTNADPGEFAGVRAVAVDTLGRILVSDGMAYIYSFSASDGSYKGRIRAIDPKNYNPSMYPYVWSNKIFVDKFGNIISLPSDMAPIYLLNPDGSFLMRFGQRGNATSAIDDNWLGITENSAGVALDDEGNIYVMDQGAPPARPARVQKFVIDRDRSTASLGSVAITSPVQNAFVPGESWITGKVNGVEPLSWTLEAGEGASPSTWRNITNSTGRVPFGILARWQAQALAEGVTTLRLTVTDGNNLQTVVTKQVNLDKTPPVVNLDNLPNGTMLPQNPLSVTGEVADSNPDSYGIKYLTVDATAWTYLAKNTTFPAPGPLGTLYGNTMASATYHVKAWAMDKAQNLTVVRRDVSINPVEYIGEAYATELDSGHSWFAVSRTGRVSVVGPNRNSIQVLDEALTPVMTINAPAGTSLVKLAFGADGEIVALSDSLGSSSLRMLRYCPDGTLTGDITVVKNGFVPDTTSNIYVLSTGEVLIQGGLTYASPYYRTHRYSFTEGYKGYFLNPPPLSYITRFIPYSDNILCVGSGSAYPVINEAGTVITTVTPPTRGTTPFTTTVDGAGNFYTGLSASTNYIEKFNSAKTFNWATGGGGYYPGRSYGGLRLMVAGRGGYFYALRANGVITAFRNRDGTADDTPPTAALDNALAGLPLQGLVTITGTATDAFAVKWKLTAAPLANPTQTVSLASSSSAVASGALTTWDTTGKDGQWLLTLTVTDQSGNVTASTLTVAVDNLPTPLVADIPSPTHHRMAQVDGTIRSDLTAFVYLNGNLAASVQGNGQGTFSISVGPLLDGANTITVNAGDQLGRVSLGQASRAVVFDCALDTQAPLVTISGFDDGISYARPVTPQISINDENLTSSTATLNGQAFTSGTILSAEGMYTIDLVVTDCGNNLTSLTRTFGIDYTSPTVVINSPADGSLTNDTSPLLSYTVSEGSVTVTVDGETISQANNAEMEELTDGLHTIRVDAFDAAGNSGHALTSIDVDRTYMGPGVQEIAVSDGLGGEVPIHPMAVSLSQDGRYMGFITDEPLLAADTNSFADVYLLDIEGGLLSLVSANSQGQVGDQPSTAVAVSAYGRKVAFTSAAGNLVAADTNGHTDVFLKNTLTGEITRVSVSSLGEQGNADSGQNMGLSIDAQGRAIAFQSDASTLVDADENGVTDIFVHTLATNSEGVKTIV